MHDKRLCGSLLYWIHLSQSKRLIHNIWLIEVVDVQSDIVSQSKRLIHNIWLNVNNLFKTRLVLVSQVFVLIVVGFYVEKESCDLMLCAFKIFFYAFKIFFFQVTSRWTLGGWSALWRYYMRSANQRFCRHFHPLLEHLNICRLKHIGLWSHSQLDQLVVLGEFSFSLSSNR